jgi:PAS domain S-box-containing protein
MNPSPISHEGSKMRDENKTKKQLINELTELRQRVDEFETLEKERKHTEESLSGSEDQLWPILDSLPLQIVYVDSEGRYRFNNRMFEGYSGYLREEVYGKHIKEVHGEVTYEEIRPYIEGALSGQEVSFEKWIRYGKGEDRYVRATHVPHFDEEGKVKGFFTLFDDLTEHKRKDEELERYEQSLEKLVEERTAKLILAIKELQREIDEHKQAEENLQQERDLLNHITQTSPAGITVVDREGRVTFANARAEAVLGLKKDEITQRTYNDPEWRITAFDGSPLPDEELPFQRVMTTGLPVYDKRHAIEWPNGRRVLLSVNAAPLFDSHGRADGMVATVEDITERIRMEEELRESEKRYRNLIENAPIGIMVTATGKVVFCNRKESELFGLASPLEMQGRAISEFVCKDDLPKVVRLAQTIRRGKAMEQPVSFRGVRADGKEIVVEGFWLRGQFGAEESLLSFHQDITEHKQAEEALRASEARYSRLFETAREAIIVSGPDGRVISANPAAAAMLGCHSPQEVIGRPSANAFADPAERQRIFSELETKGYAEGFDVTLIKQDGSGEQIHVSGSSTLHRGSDGQMERVEAILTDVTERRRAEQALKESESRLRSIIESSKDGVIFFDGRTRKILFGNGAMAELLGCSKEDLVGRSIPSLHSSEEWESIEQEFQKHVSGELSVSTGIPVLRNDGSVFYADISSSPIALDGRSYFSAFFRDVTERKRMEEVLKESIKLLNDTGEMAKVGGWELDLSTKEVLLTEELYRIHGLEPGYNLKLEEALDFYAPESRPDVEAVLKKAAETGEPYDLESLFIPRGSKDKIWVRSLGKAVYSGGKIVKLTGTFQNIDKYKRAEEELKAERQRLRDVLEAMPIMVCLLEPDYHVAFANRAFREKFGESHGRHCYEYCFWKKEPCDFCETYRVLKTAKPHHWQVTTPDGASVIDVYDFPFTDVDGSPMILEVDIDITERKRAEEERERLLAEIAAKNQELESFVYTISHDLKAPLVSMNGFSSVLQKEYESQLGKEGKHYLERIQANVAHMDTLITSLLELSRIGQVVGPIEEIDVAALLREVRVVLAGRLKEAGAEFVVQEPLPTVRADRDRIHQVFVNLIDNAVKFRSAERALRIEVGCQQESGFCRFHVADNGIGIAPQYHEQIFTPFQKLHPEIEGVGIGLVIVKKIVEHHGGRVWVESEAGKGSTFYKKYLLNTAQLCWADENRFAKRQNVV